MYRKRRLLFHLLFWTLGFVTSFGTYLTLGAPWFALAISASNTLLLATIFYFNSWLVRTVFLKGRYGRYLVWTAILIVISMLCRLYENSWLMEIFDNHPETFAPAIMIVTGSLLSLGSWAISFVLVLWEDRLAKERRQLERMDQMRQVQLKYLKMQINPHFLFNSINNIYGLALKGSEHTAQSLLTLSEILRYSLYSNQDDMVPVEEEINQIRTLIDLYALRKKAPLNIQFTVSGDSESELIPVMLFLPIIENCFKHGDIFMSKEGFIRIQMEISENQIWFHCENSFGNDMQKDEVGGIGLQNIRERLKIIYPEMHIFKYVAANHVFSVDLILKR